MYTTADPPPRAANACEWTAYAVFVVVLGALALRVPEAVVFFGLPALAAGVIAETAPKPVRRVDFGGAQDA